MVGKAKRAKYTELLRLLRAGDTEDNPGVIMTNGDAVGLGADLDNYFASREHRQAVLGLDIYKYSRFETKRQRLVPVLFRYLYDQAMHFCVRDEPSILASRFQR